MSRCFFCRRKVGKRVRSRLDYEAIYARDPTYGYLTCVDCFDALETSIKNILRARASKGEMKNG